MKPTRILPLGLTLLLTAASCGGGGPSREDFAAEVEPVCKAVNEDLQALTPPQSAEEAVAYMQEVGNIIDAGVAALRSAEPPEDDEEAVEEWIDKLAEGEVAAQEALAAAEAGDQAGFEAALQEIDAISQEANGMAEDLGLEDCAEE